MSRKSEEKRARKARLQAEAAERLANPPQRSDRVVVHEDEEGAAHVPHDPRVSMLFAFAALMGPIAIMRRR